VIEQEVRDLRDGKDEDEVVEELECRRPPFLTGDPTSFEAAHDA